MSTPHLLGTPLEVRELIYRALLPDDWDEICLVLDRMCDPASHRSCWHSLALCCHKLHDEVRAFVARRTLRISTRHDSANLYANFSCLCGFRYFPPYRICVNINPFQYRQTIPSLYTAMLCTSRDLRKIPRLPRVEIRFEGILPRRTPPFCVDELDLERAPLHMIVLFFPFRVLNRVAAGYVSIVGGPLNDPWADYRFLTEFAKQVCRSMETEEAPSSLLLELVVKLEHALQGGIIWDEVGLSRLVELGLYPRRVLGSPPWNGSVLAGLHHRCKLCGNLFQSQSQTVQHSDLFHDDRRAVEGGGGGRGN